MSEEAKEFFVTWKDMNDILSKLQNETLNPLIKTVAGLKSTQNLMISILGINLIATVAEIVIFLRLKP